MASTTKIMTCIIALENSNLTDTVTISNKASSIHGSTLGLPKNSKITIILLRHFTPIINLILLYYKSFLFSLKKRIKKKKYDEAGTTQKILYRFSLDKI